MLDLSATGNLVNHCRATAPCGVEKRLKMLIYASVNCAISALFALPFHIPVQTHAALEFRLNGKRLVMQEGECWYINANMPHSVANQSEIDRIHLVVDVGVNDWLRQIFDMATAASGSPAFLPP